MTLCIVILGNKGPTLSEDQVIQYVTLTAVGLDEIPNFEYNVFIYRSEIPDHHNIILLVESEEEGVAMGSDDLIVLNMGPWPHCTIGLEDNEKYAYYRAYIAGHIEEFYERVKLEVDVETMETIYPIEGNEFLAPLYPAQDPAHMVFKDQAPKLVARLKSILSSPTIH